jgi:hypothetical protein
MLAAIGSTMTQATEASSSGTWLYGAMVVSATADSGTPAEPGTDPVSAGPAPRPMAPSARSSRATPLPLSASSASSWPW